MKAKELRTKSIAELNKEHIELLRELFNLRLQKVGQEKVAQSHRFQQIRRDIARILTVIHEKRMNENAN